MTTMKVKVTGKSSGQTGSFDFIRETSDGDGRWRQRGGTLKISGLKGVAESGSAVFGPVSLRLGWADSDGALIMDFMNMPSEYYKQCGRHTGVGAIYMPVKATESNKRAIKEVIEWEIELPPCLVS